MIHFEIPKNQSSIIKVIGVGGGGSNAINYMYGQGIEGVDFVVCNTDSQALAQSPIPNKIQLGPHLTQGLGAGANPEIGRQAGEESEDDISKILKVNTRMAFITAGMGGGTGTGAAPVIAKICKELGILTVGIVTTPFGYEGRKRMKQAQEGINAMRENVDTILIISNDKLRQQFGNLGFNEAFSKADNILATAAKCITDLITVDGRVNLDFNDVQTVMKNGGVAILGSAQVKGEDRAKKAIVEALNSPLLNDDDIKGAKWILLNITSAPGEHEHTLDELDIIQSYIQQQAGNNCDIILGMGQDPDLGEKLAVTVIATGFQQNEIAPNFPPKADASQQPEEKIVVTLNDKNGENAIQKAKEAQDVHIDPLAPRLVTNEPPAATNIPPISHSDHHNAAGYASSGISYEPGVKHTEVKPSMSAEDENERRLFEERKKAFEERAERLRNFNYNYSNSGSPEEIENIPAYMRKMGGNNTPGNNPSDALSNYSVNKESDPNEIQNGPIHTINTFLDGEKPD